MRAALLAILTLACGSGVAQGAWWAPTPAVNLHYQLGKQFNMTTDVKYNVTAYAVDGFDTPAGTVAAMRAKALQPICYISAGSAEEWRADYTNFPATSLGAPLDGWAGEVWLDIRNVGVRAIMVQRMQMCKSKGFLAVDPDNVDGYTNPTGFPLTAADQLQYLTFLAGAAHDLGLAIGLKNDIEQIPDLASAFDFAVNEQCWAYNECSAYQPFINSRKPVYNIEYSQTNTEFTTKVCPQAAALGIKSVKQRLQLDAWRLACPGA